MTTLPENNPHLPNKEKVRFEVSREDILGIFSALAGSTRDESRKMDGGYSLSKDDLKIFRDKLVQNAQLLQDNLLVTEEVEYSYEDGTLVRFQSFDQFLLEEQNSHIQIVTAELKFSFVLAFFRPDEDRKFERQSISIKFHSGEDGHLLATIRSTEITWPPSYFLLIEQEFFNLRARSFGVQTVQDVGVNHLEQLILRVLRSKFSDVVTVPIMFTMIFAIIGIMGLIVIALLGFQFIPYSDGIRVFDEQSGLFVKKDAQELINQLGWQDAANLALLSDQLFSSDLIEEKPVGRVEVISALSERFKHPFVWLVSVCAALTVSFCVGLLRRANEYRKAIIDFSGRAVDNRSAGPILGNFTLSIVSGLIVAAISALVIPLY